jgi:hypothetical protein
MAESKILLIAKLDAAREELLRSGSRLREDLNMQKHVRGAFDRHKGAWIGGAAAVGWLLAKLPRRKAAVQHNGATPHHHNGSQAGKYALSGILLAVLRTALTTLKPALTSIASRKIKDLAEQKMRW